MSIFIFKPLKQRKHPSSYHIHRFWNVLLYRFLKIIVWIIVWNCTLLTNRLKKNEKERENQAHHLANSRNSIVVHWINKVFSLLNPFIEQEENLFCKTEFWNNQTHLSLYIARCITPLNVVIWTLILKSWSQVAKSKKFSWIALLMFCHPKNGTSITCEQVSKILFNSQNVIIRLPRRCTYFRVTPSVSYTPTSL